MTRDEILHVLSEHRDRLQEFGAVSIALFGSVARGEERAESDVDILVTFAVPPTFDQYMDLKFYLEDLLARPVDLVSVRALRPRVRERVERKAIRVP
jgi:predicted nucleotidyltransferase